MSPAFELSWLTRRPYRDFHPALLDALAAHVDWPEPPQYDELARAVPQAPDAQRPRFVVEDRAALEQAGGYEQHVAKLAAVPTRPANWHDFFNMTVWAHFPKLRWALNALHVGSDIGPRDPRNGRAPAQNLAASFDESGMLVVSSSRSLLEELRALRFQQVFWQRRDELLETTHFWLVGHGLLESLLTPHSRLAARSLLLHLPVTRSGTDDEQRFALDALVAERIQSWRERRAVLDPIPLLAIPGYADNDAREFYENPQNVVFEPLSRRPTAASASF